MTSAITALRLSFILLFGAMSVMHGPVMTFSTAHASAPAGHHQPAQSDHDSHHAVPDCHDDQTPPAKHARCNAFACLVAVEPLPVTARALSSILFAVMAAAPMTSIDPLGIVPALPPPRLQS
jgi:hypothetical protein